MEQSAEHDVEGWKGTHVVEAGEWVGMGDVLLRREKDKDVIGETLRALTPADLFATCKSDQEAPPWLLSIVNGGKR